MSFYHKLFRKFQMSIVSLMDHSLNWVQEKKYLRVIICVNGTDDMDILRQIESFYARKNMLIKKFKKCSVQVKVQLFKTYCNNISAGHLRSRHSSRERKIKT